MLRETTSFTTMDVTSMESGRGLLREVKRLGMELEVGAVPPIREFEWYKTKVSEMQVER